MVDLNIAMHDAARSGVAHRPALAAAPVLHRIRRRRATRRAVEGTVGVATAGAVAFGAVQLAPRTDPPPLPAGTVEPSPETLVVPECGGLVEEPNPGADPTVSLTGEVSPSAVTPGQGLQATVRLVNHSSRPFDLARSGPPVLLAAQAGVVVSDVADGLSGGPQTELAAGAAHPYEFDGDLVPCDPADGDTLPAGEYELFAFQQIVTDPATGDPALTILGGPWAFTVDEPLSQDPEPTVEPPVTPAGPPPFEDLVISTEGLGPLLLGSQVPDAPSPTDVIVWDPTFCEGTEVPGRWTAAYPDVPTVGGWDWRPFLPWVAGSTVSRITITGAGPHTAEGVEVGSTLAELQVAHPDVELLTLMYPYEGIDVWGIQADGNLLAFEVSASAEYGEWTPEQVGQVVAIGVAPADLEPYPAVWGSETCG